MPELGSLVVALYIAAVVVAVLVSGIAYTRFYDAYFNRYFPDDHKRIWPYLKRHFRERFAWLRPVGDRCIERRRRQFLLATVPLVVLVVIFFAAIWILDPPAPDAHPGYRGSAEVESPERATKRPLNAT